jgi:hypothetical protein
MEQPKQPQGQSAADVTEELRQLAQSFAALGRTMFREGRSLTAELLRSTRGIVERAREEIERLGGERPPK